MPPREHNGTHVQTDDACGDIPHGSSGHRRTQHTAPAVPGTEHTGTRLSITARECVPSWVWLYIPDFG